MVEFLTLFLALTRGPTTIDLGVTGDVAAIEVRLDDQRLGVLTEPPWSFEYDFGLEPEPHKLEAIAFDADGEEIDRAVQWLNVAISTSGATLTFETDRQGRPRVARLDWEAIGQRRPESIEMLFDGEPLPVGDPGHVPLPDYDPKTLHFVSAVLHFDENRTVHLDASFGGVYGEELSSELTAVPLVLERRSKLPNVEELATWFMKDGEPLPVHGVEKGFAEVVIVRDPAAQRRLGEMIVALSAATMEAYNPHRRRSQEQRFGDFLLATPGFGNKGSLSFISPFSAPLLQAGLSRGMFAWTEPADTRDGGLLWHVRRLRPASFPLQLADAVALAGLDVHSTHRRGAVILVLGDDAEDASLLRPEASRRFLESLRVPLYVWSFHADAPHPRWGDVRFVGTPPGKTSSLVHLRKAVNEVRRDLEAQRVVWIRGHHRPQKIELAGGVSGVRLAGTGLAPPRGEPEAGSPRRIRAIHRVPPVVSREPPVRSLTPVAVTLDDGASRPLPAPESMDGWFVRGDESLEVVHTDRGPAEVVIVRDPASQPRLDLMADVFLDSGRARTRIRAFAPLGEGRLRFVSPFGAPVSQVQAGRQIFAHSARFDSKGQSFLSLVAKVPSLTLSHRLADAVALSARELHASGRRRAVVVLFGKVREDESRHPPKKVRAELEDLQVPLFVWSTASEEAHPDWGEVRFVAFEDNDPDQRINAEKRFATAAAELERHLAAQRIVWLAGDVRPGEVELGPGAVGVRLAGTGQAPPDDSL